MSTAEAPRAPQRRYAGVLGLLVSVGFLAAVVWWALRQEAPQLPTSGARLAELGGAILLYGVATLLRGERWQVLLIENGARPSRADTYGLIAVGYLGNNVLPARAGDALRLLLLTPRAQTDRRTVLGTLLAERLCDVLVLGLMFVLLAYGVLSGAGTDVLGDRAGTAAVVLAVLLAVCLLVGLLLHTRGHLRRAVDWVRPMLAATSNLTGRHGAEVLLLTLLVWGCEGGVWWLTAEAAGLDVGFVGALYLLALSSMLVLIPAGPGYAGTLDAAIVIGAKALDQSSRAALSYLILLRFVLMVPVSVAGLIVAATRYGGARRLLRASS